MTIFSGEVLRKTLTFSALSAIGSFGVGCKLLKPEGASSEEYSGDRVPMVAEGEDQPTFDNATEAIMAARSKPASEALGALEAKFKAGDYEGALAGARKLKVGAEGEDLDGAVFIEGACLYYLGRHDEAQAPLDRHRSEFSKSRYRESSLYYSGSNLVKQSRWRAGGDALDAFIARYPESLLMEFALYDRATVHYALGEHDECLSMADRIDKQFLYSKIRDRSGVLKGDVLRKKGQTEQAEAAFLSAKNLAESYGHPKVAARALRNLIEVSAEGGRHKDSVTYYQTFFQKYPDSSQAPAAALAGLPALKETDGLDGGLDRMENVLLTMPETTSPRALNKSLRTYAKYFREMHGPEELLKRYGNLSSTGRGSAALREQLIIARLEVLEDYFPGRTSEIRVFYDEIRSRFDRRQLSTPTVLKIGRYVAETEPAEAAAWFREVIARPGSELKAEAALGLAGTDAALDRPADAEDGYRTVLETFGTPALEEEATAGLARSLGAQSQWAKARDAWAHYLSHEAWTSVREEAQNGLAAATEKAGGAPMQPIISSKPPPAAPPEKPAPASTGNRYADKLVQAERMVEKGMKPQAFELVKSMVEAGEAIEEPDPVTKKALRRAGIMKENLGLELNLK